MFGGNSAMPNSAQSAKIRTRSSLAVLVILHTVGLFGLASDAQSWFLALTPLNLWLSLLILLINHRAWSVSTNFVLALAFLVGFFVEVAGVETGFIFGDYTYGATLGLRLFDVPLVMGANWALLVFASGALVAPLKIHWMGKAAIAALSMTLLDVLIEPVAMQLDFWDWANHTVPFQNYAVWFIVAFGLHLAFQKWVQTPHNKVAVGLFIIQVIFFGGLNLML